MRVHVLDKVNDIHLKTKASIDNFSSSVSIHSEEENKFVLDLAQKTYRGNLNLKFHLGF